MVTIEKAIELMHKYGFSSTSDYPYLYVDDANVGICYNYVDDDYGYLERVKFFDNDVIMEEFLKRIQWMGVNGKVTNSRMVLDNYQIRNPKNMFLRNGKIMVKGEMYDIEDFKRKEAEKEKLDPVSRALAEAGDLITVYDDLKARQLDYFKNVRVLDNELRNKYFELQQEVDKYNNVQVERTIKLLPDVVSNDGVNQMMETSVKDRYNQYKVQPPELSEAQSFLKDVWELNHSLEMNSQYYDAMVTENNCRNEIKIVDVKIEFMKKLNVEKRVFKVDLMKKFRNINNKVGANNVQLSNDFISNKLNSIEKKYSFYDYLSKNKLADYLKEAIINTNYSDVAIKYAATNTLPPEFFVKKPANEVVADLFVQYKNSLNYDEQTILVLYNSKFRELFDLIFEIDNFDTLSAVEINDIISKKRGFSKIKSLCYDYVKGCINDECNADVKTKLFSKIDFTTFETFLNSVLGLLKSMKNINNKLRLNSDLNMYFFVSDPSLINNGKFMFVTSDLNSLKIKVNSLNNMIAITCLKNNLPVLYSPYCLDFGNLYDKKNRQLTIKEAPVFELLIDKDDVSIYVDDNVNLIVDYQAVKKTEGDYTIVTDINSVNKINYCKMALFNNVLEEESK